MKIKKILLTALGFFLLLFAVLGAILPVMPAAPFVIAAFSCFCYSPRLKKMLLWLPVFREHIKNYQNRAGLENKTVLLSLLYIWTGLTVSISLIKTNWICLFLCAVGITLTYHILYMTGAKKPKQKYAPKSAPTDNASPQFNALKNLGNIKGKGLGASKGSGQGSEVSGQGSAVRCQQGLGESG